MTAPPVPIMRSSAFFPHAGHLRRAGSVIE
jgi:hypothetical protein